jgi:hypothetical protein
VRPRPLAPELAPAAGPEDGGLGNFFLGCGRVMSALGCAGSVVYLVRELVAASELPRGALQSGAGAVVTATLSFTYFAAMFVVFGRVRRLPPG